MVNPAMVNLESACASHVHFRDFFPFFARFLLFENPIKYSCRLRINQSFDRLRRIFLLRINDVTGLTVTQDISAILFQNRKAPFWTPNGPEGAQTVLIL
jgi:hypothetical protein